MYWPDELPAGTTDGRKYVQGRQPYHGAHELIASNHSTSFFLVFFFFSLPVGLIPSLNANRGCASAVDIINVVSVTAMAHVNHWVEENDDEIQNALYWRQAFDFRNLELSVCRLASTLPPLPALCRRFSDALLLFPPLCLTGFDSSLNNANANNPPFYIER